MPRLAGALSLLALTALSFHLRVRLSTYTPRFDPADEACYFRTESAYQYRYARLASRGEAIPELDRAAQWPEGVRTRSELTLWMEYATAWAYRLLPTSNPPDFRWFVILWVAAVSSLSVPAFYAVAARLTRSSSAALAAAAVYALSWGAMSNVIATYVFESFALSLILGSLACLAAALDLEEKSPRPWALAAGLLLAAALASWHFTRFCLLAFVLALVWTAWAHRREAGTLSRLRAVLEALLPPLAAAGLLVASLRENAFVLSPAMILLYGLLAALAFPGRARPIALAAAAAAVCQALGARDSGSYGHVYALFLSKLSHGLVKPADPALLSDEARALWMGPFNSPGLGFSAFALFPMALILVPRTAGLLRREEAAPAGPLETFVDALFVLFASGAVLVLRLMQMLAFFLCLEALRLPRRAAARTGLIALLASVAALEGLKSLAPASRLNPFMSVAASLTPESLQPTTSFADERGVVRWVADHGGKGTPVLAGIPFSATFLTYAGSPILIHPKFEAPGIRRKTAEYLRALYSDEETFLAYCRKYGARLFVLSVYEVLDETPDGPRYASGSLRLGADSAAALMHFQPEKLKSFRLVYQNEGFRVFAVGEKPAPQKSGAPAPAIYDLARFSPRTAPDGSLTLDVPGVLKSIRESRLKVLLAKVLARTGRGNEALRAYEEAFALWPPDAETSEEARRLNRALEAAGRP